MRHDCLRAEPMDIERAIVEQLPPNATVLDVGANVGDFARMVLEVRPEAHIVSFEPNPEAFAVLELLREEAWPRQNLYTANVALGERSEFRVLYYTEGPCKLGSLRRRTLDERYHAPGTHGKSMAECRVWRLDDWWLGANPDLIKIDVEGHEEEVLRGATGLLTRTARVLFEVLPDANFEDGYVPSLARIGTLLVAHGFNEPRYLAGAMYLAERH